MRDKTKKIISFWVFEKTVGIKMVKVFCRKFYLCRRE